MAIFEEMREKHRKDSMLTLSFFLFFMLIFVFHTQYLNAVTELLIKPENTSDIFKKSWLIIILTLISPVATYFFGIISIAKRDLYYPIDNLVFKKRLKVDQYICKEMLTFRIGLAEKDQRDLEALKQLTYRNVKCKHILSLFYHYMEKPNIVNPELKSQAFIYWGDYFSSMMFVVWGVLFLLIAIFIVLSDKSITSLRLVVWIIMLLLTGFNFVGLFLGKTAKKLFEIPQTQVREIHRNAAQNLLLDLRNEDFFLKNE